MTIGKKVYLSFACSLGIAFVGALVAFSTIGTLGQTVSKLVHRNARRQFLAGQLELHTAQLVSIERAVCLRSFIKDSGAIEQYNRDFAETNANLLREIEEFRPFIETEQGRKAIQELSNTSEAVRPLHQELYSLASAGNPMGAADLLKDRMLPLLTRSGETAHALLTLQSDLMAKVTDATEQDVTADRRLMLAMLGLCLAVGAAIVWIVRRMNRDLQRTARELGESAAQVASAAGQVASTSQSVAQGASQHAASLEETTSASEEIRAMSRESSQKTEAAANLVKQAQQAFGETNAKLNQMVGAMDGISASSSGQDF